ncbi:hypothetical protein PR202_gb13899 [Eleusine coracana subsp. coracana]|uniref:Uncharacterized protein n=1 Tax=Eleusine coracana subsp. coracana TaxID=191504 RepID=A0AAV5ETV9_ELECO|nr:hypothetical protein PR202_gb13899 [Eleusine coracana subsp. coracana]
MYVYARADRKRECHVCIDKPKHAWSASFQRLHLRLRLDEENSRFSVLGRDMAATANHALLLPVNLPSRISFPTRVLLLHSPRPAHQRLIAASSKTEPSPISSETPEAREIRLETEAALEMECCVRAARRLRHHCRAGRAACGKGRVPVGRSRAESERLIEQTAAAVLLSAPLDFGGVEDVSAVVAAAAGGRLLSVREICGVGRSIRAARQVFDQLHRLADEMPDGRFSPLLDILQGCDFLSELVQRIEFCLDSNLSLVLDRASKKLETIRKERRKEHRDVRNFVERYVSEDLPSRRD